MTDLEATQVEGAHVVSAVCVILFPTMLRAWAVLNCLMWWVIVKTGYPCYAREEPRLSTGWINIKNHNYIANYISRIY